MFIEQESRAKNYGGYNPSFVRRALARRKAKESAEAAALAKAEVEAAKREAEEALRREEEREKHAVAKLLSQYREMEIAYGKKPVRTIILETAMKHGLRYEDLVGRSRRIPIVAARHEAMWRAHHERTDLSLSVLGRAFGGRDHTTVLSAIRKMDRIHGGKCPGDAGEA